MDMTCNCKPGYTCVACRVKRGDYMDWRDQPPAPRAPCSVAVCNREAAIAGMCWRCYNNHRYQVRMGRAVHLPIPQRPYVPMSER